MNVQLAFNEDAISTLASRQRGMTNMQGCSTKYEEKASEGRRVNKQEEGLAVLRHMEPAQEEATWFGLESFRRSVTSFKLLY